MHPNNWTSTVVQYSNLFFETRVSTPKVSWKISATGSYTPNGEFVVFVLLSKCLTLGSNMTTSLSGGFWKVGPGAWGMRALNSHIYRSLRGYRGSAISPRKTRGPASSPSWHCLLWLPNPFGAKRSHGVTDGDTNKTTEKPRNAFELCVVICWIFWGWNMVNPAISKGL